MSIAIKVENLSKQYRLGSIGTGTLSHDLNRSWAKLLGKPDPFLKVGETNDRTTKGSSNLVWALKDINFEVQQGEILGIIGKNGAGKSTLLKILSKVTGPTTGKIKAKGRIASLLEVGTGFHPELTGRENIYLNGAILGMSKSEINSKLDEIVEFAGVERYLDTPVKRYSSGMMVRLGFAVAAHLEPEILVVDEVLAVGDAEFQKRAIGKMQEVSTNQGRTVLFVSHNMSAVQNLCNKCILLSQGNIELKGTTNEIIEQYLNINSVATKQITNNLFDIYNLTVNDQPNIDSRSFNAGENIELKGVFLLKYFKENLRFRLNIINSKSLYVSTLIIHPKEINENIPYQFSFKFNTNSLLTGSYSCLLTIDIPGVKNIINNINVFTFEVLNFSPYNIKYPNAFNGVVLLENSTSFNLKN